MKLKIQCEAIAKHSGKRCKCKGYFVPSSRRMLCCFHKGSKSWDYKTRKYRGLYRNDNVSIQNKINILKNLVNFRNKTDDEIKEYILKEKQRSSAVKYRTKYFTRHYLRWRNSTRGHKKELKDQLDNFLQVLREKSKV